MAELPPKEPKPLSGSETFLLAGKALPFTVRDFWSWAASDLLNNAQRGVLAEFIVGKALGLSLPPRLEWDAFDLQMPDGTTLEVKSAAYLQSWSQIGFSNIRFGISPTRGWNASTNTYAKTIGRQADCYVFCLLAHKDKATVDPTDLAQWQFQVVSKATLDRECPGQKSIGIRGLKAIGAISTDYSGLPGAVAAALEGNS